MSALPLGCDERLTYLRDYFVPYDTLVGLAPDDHEVAIGLADLLALGVKHFHDEGESASAPRLKLWIRSHIPDFDEEDHGFPSFRHLLAHAEAMGRLRVDSTPRGHWTAYPVDADQTVDGRPLIPKELWAGLIPRIRKQGAQLFTHSSLRTWPDKGKWPARLGATADTLMELLRTVTPSHRERR